MLRDAGLVEARTDAQRRVYRIRLEPLQAVDEWLAPYRAMWPDQLDDLARHLDAMADDPRDDPSDETLEDRHDPRARRPPEGRLEQVGDRWVLTFVRLLPHPPEKVWRAVTEPEHLAAWFPTEIHGERSTGATLRFVFRDDEGPTFKGRMIRCEPPSVLEFDWGGDTLRFELEAVRGRHPADAHRHLRRAGEGRPERGRLAHLPRRARLRPRRHLVAEAERGALGPCIPGYVERLGPEASTIGPPDR